jgi:hypothetical protein
MFTARTWKYSELRRIGWLLDRFPERHVRFNEGFSRLNREDYLTVRGAVHASAAGYYRTGTKSVVLFNPAFWGTISLGDREVRALDFSLWSLVGFSLFTTLEVRKTWPPIVYPGFDRGAGSRPELKLVDRERIRSELSLSGGRLCLDPQRVSLDRSFAYCYACYALVPDHLLRSLPEAYLHLKTCIFAGREFRPQRAALVGAGPLIRA